MTYDLHTCKPMPQCQNSLYIVLWRCILFTHTYSLAYSVITVSSYDVSKSDINVCHLWFII